MHLLQVVVEFAVVLGTMVLIHEFGHFAMGKLCGVRIEAFALGFGTRLFGVHYRGTDYRVNLLPLGGYVKFAGEMQPLPADMDPTVGMTDPGEFNAHPRWQRALIAVAGPAANFLLAFFLLAFAAHFHHEVSQYLNGPAVVDYVVQNTPAARDGLSPGDTILSLNGHQNPTWLQVMEESALAPNRAVPFTFLHNGQVISKSITTPPMDSSGEPSDDMFEQLGFLPRMQATPVGVEIVSPDTPAANAGLQPGDQILRIDNLALHSVPTLLAYLKDHGGAPSTLLVERKGRQWTVPITPRQMPGATGEMGYKLGFQAKLMPVDIVHLPLGKSIKQSVKDNADDSTLILRVLKGMFTRQVAVKSVSGPVGMAQMIDVAAHEGYWTLVRLMSSISLNLGILNLLPFPVLDGGMIIFLIVEGVMRRDVNQNIKERVYQVAFVCIILFAALVMFNDIAKLHLRP